MIGNCRRGYSCYEVAGDLVELCSSVLWKIELESDELGYSAEEISEPSVEGACFVYATQPVGFVWQP